MSIFTKGIRNSPMVIGDCHTAYFLIRRSSNSAKFEGRRHAAIHEADSRMVAEQIFSADSPDSTVCGIDTVVSPIVAGSDRGAAHAVIKAISAKSTHFKSGRVLRKCNNGAKYDHSGQCDNPFEHDPISFNEKSPAFRYVQLHGPHMKESAQHALAVGGRPPGRIQESVSSNVNCETAAASLNLTGESLMGIL